MNPCLRVNQWWTKNRRFLNVFSQLRRFHSCRSKPTSVAHTGLQLRKLLLGDDVEVGRVVLGRDELRDARLGIQVYDFVAQVDQYDDDLASIVGVDDAGHDVEALLERQSAAGRDTHVDAWDARDGDARRHADALERLQHHRVDRGHIKAGRLWRSAFGRGRSFLQQNAQRSRIHNVRDIVSLTQFGARLLG